MIVLAEPEYSAFIDKLKRTARYRNDVMLKEGRLYVGGELVVGPPGSPDGAA